MIEEKIKNNYPLANFSTFKIGGPAEYFVELETKEEVEEAWIWAKEKNIPITILGGGSNVLISDNGVKGLVIKLHNQTLECNDTEIVCGAGVVVKELVEKAFENDLSGIEWSIGIPGSVGGAIRGNAGAHGGSYDTAVDSVLVFDSLTHGGVATSELHVFFDPVTYLMYGYSNGVVSSSEVEIIINNAGAAGTSLSGDTPQTLTVDTSGLINWTH